ncbi:CYTH and CHAD domain-containing protein [Thermodesulfobium sp. 4217-1]|uniref:CYTH and CHAD domain-containing protein n=1 Tax=Thermodesulfobium sp. 4217-1 TaxID=3120013 RepID=UPI0032216B8B
MNTNIEIELKLRCIFPEKIDEIYSLPLLSDIKDEWKKKEIRSIYYDTAENIFLNSGISLRTRLEDGEWTQTIKVAGNSNGGFSRRKEYNVSIQDGKPDLTVLKDSSLKNFFKDTKSKFELTPMFETVFERSVALYTYSDKSVLELAVDRGKIISGDKTEDFCEVEIELKEGNISSILKLAEDLSKSISFLLEPKSKYYRGILLANLEPKYEIQKERDPDVIAEEGLQNELTEKLQNLILYHNRFVENPENFDNLHNFRVSLRKIRTILKFGKPLIEKDDLNHWLEQFDQITELTNPLRETDVLIEDWRSFLAITKRDDLKNSILTKKLLEERQLKLDLIYPYFSEGKFTNIFLGLWYWLLEGAFLIDDSATLRLKKFAKDRLNIWFRKTLKKLKKTDFNNERDLHKLRIATKDLRYSLEVFSFALKSDTKDMISKLKKIQDILGYIHDTQTFSAYLESLISSSDNPEIYKESGWLLGYRLHSDQSLKSDLEKQWKKFKEQIKAFID